MEKHRKIGRVPKRIETVFLSFLLLCLWPLGLNGRCWADSAEVLPKGRSAIFIEGKFYLPVDQRYNEDGNKESLAADFNTNLNSRVFPSLRLVEAGFGLPLGSGSLGNSVVSFEYDFDIIELNYAYGITDKLSFGFKIPWWDVKNSVSAELDTSKATIGKNSAVPGGFAPIGFPGTKPLTATDIQSLLARNYGYEPIQSWSRSGISDIQAFLRYQYYKSESWRLALTGGVQFPTGKEDDPDSFVDYPFGTGAWAGLLRLSQDYIGTKNLFLSTTLRYDYYFPQHFEMRIPNDVDQPITVNKETVDRKIGNYFEFEITGNYEFVSGLSFFLTYKFGYKWRDDISGSMGYAYNVAEAETNAKEQVYIVGFQYSTLPLYLEKKFPIPIIGFIGYRSRFAGENVLKSDYIDVGLTVIF
jgi:hypothetical protein